MVDKVDIESFIKASTTELINKLLDPGMNREARMLLGSIFNKNTTKKCIVELLLEYLTLVLDRKHKLEAEVDTSVLIEMVVKRLEEKHQTSQGNEGEELLMQLVWKLIDCVSTYAEMEEEFKNSEMCLRLLDNLLRQQEGLLNDRMATLHGFQIIDAMFRIVDSCKPKYHQTVIVSILGPLSTFPAALAQFPSTSRLWNGVLSACDRDGPLLLCLLLKGEEGLHKRCIRQHLLSQKSFWTTVQRYFMSRDCLSRKRAVFILKNVLHDLSDIVDVPKNGLGCDRYWLEDYVDVFSHLEGTNSTHLYEQVAAHMSHLFELVASYPVKASTSTALHCAGEWSIRVDLDETGLLPMPSFCWLKAALRMLLDLSHPTIRKLALYSLLSENGWPLNIQDAEVQQWFARELPSALDSSSYFPPQVTQVAMDGSSVVNGDEHEEFSTRIQRQYPGILLSSMVSRIVIGSIDDEQRRSFLRGLVETLCVNAAFKGILVATWAFSNFSNASILDYIPYNIFEGPELRQITSYVGVQLAAANTTLRARFYAGFVPLLVRGSCVSDKTSRGLEVFMTALDEIGLDTVIINLASTSSLLRTLRRYEIADPVNRTDANKTIHSMEWTKLSARSKLLLHAALDTEPTRKHAFEDSLLADEFKAISTYPAESFASEEAVSLRELVGSALELLALMEWLVTEANGHHSHASIISLDLVTRSILPFVTKLASGMALVLRQAIDNVKGGELGALKTSSIHSVRELERTATTLGRIPLLLTYSGLASTRKSCMSDGGGTVSQHAETIAVLKATVHDILAFLEPGQDCVTVFLALRVLSCLFDGLSRVTETPILDSTTAHTCLTSLLSLRAPLAVEFPERLSIKSKSHGAGVSDLFNDFVEISGTHGKLMNAFLRDRWTCVTRLLKVCDLAPNGTNVLLLIEMVKIEASTLSMEAVPSFLTAIFTLVQAVQGSETKDCVSGFQSILENTWESTIGESPTLDGQCVVAFVECLYSPSLAPLYDVSFIKHYHTVLLTLGKSDRPGLIHLVALRLSVLLRHNPQLLSVYSQETLELLFIREPESSARSTSNALHTIEASMQGTATRFTIMALLEDLLSGKTAHKSDIQGQLRDLILDLLAMNRNKNFKAPAMIGSDAYTRKLRCWQSLCVLSSAIDETMLDEVMVAYFTTIQDKCLPEIRTHMEIFGALLTRRFPDRLLPKCLSLLGDSNLQQHVQCTVFIVLGFILFDTPQGTTTPLDISDARIHDMITVILPWIGVSSGLSRAIALMLLLNLIPRISGGIDGASREHAHLRGIYHMINNNKDTQKVLSRQMNFFRDYPLEGKDTLSGLLSISRDPGGEIVPDNLVNVILRVFRSSVLDSQQEDRKLLSMNTSDSSFAPPEESDGADLGAVSRLQTKVVPFDELKLALQSDAYSRSLNGALRKRQNLIVCASLVDKVQNLAGIARTCEIFSVESLIMQDLRVTKSDIFQGIAVSSDRWLPMKEVKQEALLSWLRSMKSQGYTILGLEQTDDSISLGAADVSIPEKSVLLVGKEKEGIPVEYLQEVSVCFEIPQYGVIRSLNVHVSTAIAIWEISKSNFGE